MLSIGYIELNVLKKCYGESLTLKTSFHHNLSLIIILTYFKYFVFLSQLAFHNGFISCAYTY